CARAPPGSVPLLAETHAGSLLPCGLGLCQVGLAPSPVRTPWATATHGTGWLPLPRGRADLGATRGWFGWVGVWTPDSACQLCEHEPTLGLRNGPSQFLSRLNPFRCAGALSLSPSHPNSSNNALASWRSAVSKPSVNQP